MFLLKKLTRDKQESAFDENGIRRDKKKLAFTADTKKSKNLSKSGSRWKMIKKSISTINRMDYGDDLIRRVREEMKRKRVCWRETVTNRRIPENFLTACGTKTR